MGSSALWRIRLLLWLSRALDRVLATQGRLRWPTVERRLVVEIEWLELGAIADSKRDLLVIVGRSDHDAWAAVDVSVGDDLVADGDDHDAVRIGAVVGIVLMRPAGPLAALGGLAGGNVARALDVIDVIEPGAEALVRTTESGHVGVIGTVGTIGSGAYERAVLATGADVTLTSAACPGPVSYTHLTLPPTYPV